MTDRELLEAAAKAAGIDLEWDGPPELWAPMYYQGKTYHPWLPLEDDGEALRLAVKLAMETYHADDDGWHAYASHPSARGIAYAIEPHGSDPCAATRRAIVRAAAALAGS